MAADDKTVPPQGVDSAPAHVTNEPGDAVTKQKTVDEVNDPEFLKTDLTPADPEEQLDALGIPNWRDLEKQVVRRLDMTLMPCLWVLYLFNYLDRASIAYVSLLCNS